MNYLSDHPLDFSSTGVQQFAANLGLDEAQVSKCLSSGKMAARVQQDIRDGHTLGVHSVPTLFVGKTKLVGMPSYSKLHALIEQKLVESGNAQSVTSTREIGSAADLKSPEVTIYPRWWTAKGHRPPRPVLAYTPTVAYPAPAIKAGLEGIVRLRANVNADGKISKLKYVDGPPQLAKTAFQAVWQSRFRPPGLSEEVGIYVEFRLPPGSQATATHPKPLLKLAHHVKPVYPPEARAAHVQGTVQLELTVNPEGGVVEARVLSGQPALVHAAVDAVRHWRFEPPGKLVKSKVEISFRTLGDSKSVPTPGAGS